MTAITPGRRILKRYMMHVNDKPTPERIHKAMTDKLHARSCQYRTIHSEKNRTKIDHIFPLDLRDKHGKNTQWVSTENRAWKGLETFAAISFLPTNLHKGRKKCPEFPPSNKHKKST